MITFIKQDTRLKLSPWINLHNILHVLSHRGKLLTERRRWFPELGHPLSLTNACVASSVPLKIAFDVRRSPGFDFQETGLWWGLQHLRVDGWNGCQPALEQGQLVLWECTPPSLLLLFETKDTWSLGIHIITPLMFFISLWQFSYYLLLFHFSLKDFFSNIIIFCGACMLTTNYSVFVYLEMSLFCFCFVRQRILSWQYFSFRIFNISSYNIQTSVVFD